MGFNSGFKGLNAELNSICYLLALLGAHHFLHVSRIRVKMPLQELATGNRAFCNRNPFLSRVLTFHLLSPDC